MKKRDIIIAVAWMLALTACSDDYFNKDFASDSEYIGFRVYLGEDDEFQSRSAGVSSRPDRKVTIEPLDATIGSRQLYLHTEVDSKFPAVDRINKAESRGTEIKDGELEDLRVSAVVFDGEWGATGFSPQPYMNNDFVDVNSNWNTGRFWPQESEWIRFYAHAPAEVLTTAPNNIGGIPLPEDDKEPSFAYTVPANVPDQKDLLVASAQYEGDYCQTAHLEFGHALTAVEIKISGEVNNFTITGLTISGLRNQGTYTYEWPGNNGDSDATKPTYDAGSWSGQTGSATYTVFPRPTEEGETPVTELELTGEGTDVEMTDNGMLLLLMPQELPDNAMIEITGKDFLGDEVPPLRAVIGGEDAQGNPKCWDAGKRVVYTLSFNSKRIEYHLDVQPIIADSEKENVNNEDYYLSPYHGEIGRGFTVECYKQTVTAGGTIEEGPIALDWAIDESTRPWWVDHITASGKGPGTGEGPALYTASGTYSVLPNLTSSTSHNELKGRGPLGTEDNPYDLSTLGGSELMTTANCYMVTAPGWYTFPLVYGNAIKDGAPNPESFMGDTDESVPLNTTVAGIEGDPHSRNYSKQATLADGTSVAIPIHTLTNFYGHEAEGYIEHPWIVSSKGGKFNPGEVCMLWQDEPCLITNVSLNANKDHIVFYVNPMTINEGNTVITVREAEKEKHNMWNWHIWVTDQNDGIAGDFKNPTPMTNRMVTADHDPNASSASGLGKTIENTFYLMQSPIGGCDADTKTYTQAVSAIRFRIMVDGEEFVPNKAEAEYLFADNAQLKVGVNGAVIEMPYNAPYYQFGRKDPMLPGWDNSDKTFYRNDRKIGVYDKLTKDKPGVGYDFEIYGFADDPGGSTFGVNLGHVETLVINPNVFFKGSDDANVLSKEEIDQGAALLLKKYTKDGKLLYINQWNAKCNKLPVFTFYNVDADALYGMFKPVMDFGVIKTVYDPCPRGYEMPRIDAFSGTTFSSLNVNSWTTNRNLVNIADIRTGQNGGYEAIGFYTTPMPSTGTGTGEVFYIRALGHRDNTGKMGRYNKYGSALTASPICAQYYSENPGQLNHFFSYQAIRFCYTGDTWIKPFSSSNFDLAFPIIPAKTGCNPLTTEVDAINPDWSGNGNDDDYNIGF